MCHKRFRPQQGLSIMNDYMRDYRDAFRSFRPQQGLSIMNSKEERQARLALFPSPTGVKYYEYVLLVADCIKSSKKGFRPQQGLSIMN